MMTEWGMHPTTGEDNGKYFCDQREQKCPAFFERGGVRGGEKAF